MKVIRDPIRMQNASMRWRSGVTGFVPTMGALHEGHLSLIKRARRECSRVVVSIFVNPAQFGPGEDLKRYPRPLKKDISLCRAEGVDFVFTPDADTMFKKGFSTFVEEGSRSLCMCGRSRPGHFRGVATIVLKLFNIVRPDVAYFGQKDYQQAVVIRKMVSDLDVPVKIRLCPIVREKDGLALSSRNIYMDGDNRKQAIALYRALIEGRKMVTSAERIRSSRVLSRMKKIIGGYPAVRIDYLDIRDPVTLGKVERISGRVVICGACWIGKTRIIDNMII